VPLRRVWDASKIKVLPTKKSLADRWNSALKVVSQRQVYLKMSVITFGSVWTPVILLEWGIERMCDFLNTPLKLAERAVGFFLKVS